MSYQLKISSGAEDQMRRQQLWYEADDLRGGKVLAGKWFEGLVAEMAALASHPERFPFAPENGKWMRHHTIRQLVYRPWKGKAGWRVLYVIKESKKVVTVLDIRHEHRRRRHESE